MKPLYKVGDKVVIKSKYDPGCTVINYRCGFVSDMLNAFGGKICTISSVKIDPYRRNIDKMLPDDSYLYHLEEDQDEYNWATSMFDPEF